MISPDPAPNTLFSSWIKRLRGGLLTAPRAKRRRRDVVRHPAAYERLEERVLLSAEAVWTGAAGTHLWSDAGNWESDYVPQAGDDILFADDATDRTSINDLGDGIGYSSVTIAGSDYAISGDDIQLSGGISATYASGSSNFALATELTDTETISVAAGGPLELGGNISGAAGGITKAGSGTLILSGDNSYDGLTYIDSGSLIARHDHALGSTAAGTVVFGTSQLRLENGITVDEALDLQIAGRLSSGGNNEATGSISLSDFTPRIGADSGSTLTLSGEISGNDHGTLQINFISPSETGTVVLSGNNTFNYAVLVYRGAIVAASDNALGDPAAASTVSFETDTALRLSGGITLPETKSLVLNDSISGQGGNIINLDGTNTIRGTIEITQAAAQNINISSGTILNLAGVVSGAGGIAKGGEGILILSADNTNSMATYVSTGTLQVDGSVTSRTDSNHGVVSGSGTLSTLALFSDGPLAPGDATVAGSTGILSTGDLQLSNLGTYEVGLNGITAGSGYDQMNVTGSVFLSRARLVVKSGFTPTVGDTFTIIENDGADGVISTFANLAEGAVLKTDSVDYRISYTGGTGNDVTLTVLNLVSTWSGAGVANQNWSNPDNWAGGVAPTDGNRLLFPENPVGLSSVNDFAEGTAFESVTIAGAGYLITGNAITLTNGISATFGAGNSRFDLAVGLMAVETVSVAYRGTLEMGGVISGANGGITKVDRGLLVLSGDNSYDGLTTVSSGGIVLSHANALGSKTAGTVVGTGQLYINRGITLGESLSLSMGGRLIANGDSEVSGSISLVGSSISMIAEAGSTLTLSGTISGVSDNFHGTTFDIILIGSGGSTDSGTVKFSGNNTFDQSIHVIGGSLVAASDTAFGNTRGDVVRSGSTAKIILEGGVTIADLIQVYHSSSTTEDVAVLISRGGRNALTGTLALSTDTNFHVEADSVLEFGGLLVNSATHNILYKTGAGTLLISDAATAKNTKPTVVQEGTLQVDGIYDKSLVQFAGGRLTGVGQLGSVSGLGGGFLSPGDFLSGVSLPGPLQISGSLQLGGTLTYDVDLNGTAAGTEYDQLDVIGTVDLAGATLSLSTGFTSAEGDTFTLISNDGDDAVIGTFAGLAEGAVFAVGGQLFNISYTGGDGNDVMLKTVVAPNILSATANRSLITDSTAGAGQLALTVVYDRAMNSAVAPAIALPESLAGTLTLSSASGWQTATTYVAIYDVTDANAMLSVVDVTVTGGTSEDGAGPAGRTVTDLFSVDMANPTAKVFGPAGSVDVKRLLFEVNFDEPVTGFDLTDVAVANGAAVASSLVDLGDGRYRFIVTAGVADGVVTVTVAAAAAVDGVGNATTGGSGSVIFDLDRFFVRALYREVLGREGETAGITKWAASIDAGMSHSTVATAFWRSVEHRQRQVKEMYQSYLHRAADANGLNNAVTLLNSGKSENDLRSILLSSAEYRNAHPGDTNFVNALYLDVLGRTADPAGRSAWENLLASGKPANTVVNGLLTSTERYNRVANQYYADLVDRPATSQERSTAVSTLRSGLKGEELLAVALAASDDFLVM